MAVVPTNQQQQNGLSQQEKGASLQEQLYSKLGSASEVVDDRLARDGRAGAVDLDATVQGGASHLAPTQFQGRAESLDRHFKRIHNCTKCLLAAFLAQEVYTAAG